MMFAGMIFIASFGAAGILSAIAASSPSGNEKKAVNYLIGTSVSYLLIVIVDTTSKAHSF